MILPGDVIEVLDLAHLDRHIQVLGDPVHPRFVAATVVHRDLLWISVLAHRLFEEAGRRYRIPLGTQQEINGGAFLVNRTVQVLPLTIKQDAGLSHTPTFADCPLVLSEYLFQNLQEFYRPAADTGIIYVHTTFLPHFFKVAATQRVRRVPTVAQQNDFIWKSHAFHLQHRPSQPLNFGLAA
jgi:hypothetical protein